MNHDFSRAIPPEMQKPRQTKNLYLDVVDGRVRMAWTTGDKRRAEYMERADVIGLGISYDMLLDALMEAGGTLDANGRYPINDAICETLRKLLNC